MKCLLLLLALAGLSCGLQAPLHYKYKYFGSVFTGIPELSNQAAGWAMKADVQVFLENNDGHAVFQLQDFRMAEYNGDLGCDVRGDVPDELFVRAEDDILNQAVEAPFKVHLFDHDEEYVIEYPEEKFRWLANMRKGVASIFKNEILRGNIEKQIEGTVAAALHEGHVLNVFSVEEETIFGNCKVDYTVYPIPEYFAGTKKHEINELLEEDVQLPEETSAYTSKTKSKTTKKSSTKTKTRPGQLTFTGPKLEEQLWHVVRSVDFDHCNETVGLQSTPVGVHEEVHGGQYKWVKGRSSVTEFIFRGSPGHARMEKAIVEGATTKLPIGLKTEVLQARINQTLELVSVTIGEEVPTATGKLHRTDTWMQEVYSPFETPKQSKLHPWVIYTGEGSTIKTLQTYGLDHFAPEQTAEIKVSIIEYVTIAAKILTDKEQDEREIEPGTTVEYLQKASFLFEHLNKEDILKIFDHFFDKETEHKDVLANKLIIDAAAASGTYFAQSAILDYIKQGKIPRLQIMTIFMTLTNNAEGPTILPEIMDYALTLNMKKEPFLTATVLINFAELLDNMCNHPHAREIHYSGPIYGDHGCNKSIKDQFLPYLKDIIYSDTTTWEKDIAIQVLHTLGSPNTLPILVPVVEGKVTCSPRVRALAIYALESWKLERHGHIRTQVMDLLTDVYSDIGHDAEVREAALSTIVSWHPEPTFWHRLARTSWREPSKQFASFISSLIHSFANFEHPEFVQQNQAAHHAVKFTKPIAPSLKYSYIQIMTSRIVDRHLSRYQAFSWHSTERSYNSKEFYYFLMTNLGGIDFVNMELFSVTEGFFERFRDILHKKQNEGGFDGMAAKIAEDFYNKIQETVQAQTVHHHVTPKSDLFLRMFDHMNLFLPLNKETLSTLHLFDPKYIADLFSQLSHGYDLVLGKFLNPFDTQIVQPTELGLPLFLTIATPTVFSGVSYSHLDVAEKSFNVESLDKLELSVHGLTTISSETHSSLKVLLPWCRQFVGTGIRSTRDITLPLNVVLRRSEKKEEGAHHQITHIDLHSHYKQKFSLVRASNVPYTTITPVLPLKTAQKPNIQIITDSKLKERVIQVPNTYSGLNFDLTWKSEMAFPFTTFRITDFISHPELVYGSPWLLYSMATPTTKYWYADLEFDPQQSKTKNITLEFVVGTFGKETQRYTQETDGQFSQYGQDALEQYDHEQTFDVDQGFQEIGESEVETLNRIHYGDTTKQRSQKMQEYFRGTAYTKSLKIDLQGEEHREYEIIYSYSMPKVLGTRKQEKSQISIIRSAIPHVDDKPSSVCLDVQNELPAFSKLDKVEDILSMNLNKEIRADVTIDCKGAPVATLKGTYQLSGEWKEKLQHDLPEACDYDRYNPLYTLHSHAVYDDLKYTLTWDKVCDIQKHPLTTTVFDTVEEIINIALHKTRCSTTEPQHKIEVEVHRSPRSSYWYINAKREDAEFHFEEIPHSNYFNYLFGIGHKLTEFHSEHVTTFNTESETCAVGTHDVRTFDGFTYGFEATPCWTVAAKDCHNEKGWMLLVRSPQGHSVLPDAKFIDVKRGLVIEYTKQTVKVNGKVVEPVGEQEVVRDDHGQIIVVVHKKNDYHMVQFAEDFYISATDKLKIHIPKDLWGDMCGLCGNHDGEPESEFVGPHRCFYDDAKMFAAAWTGESDTCDLYTLHELRKYADKLQKEHCHTIESLHEKCPHFNERCYKFGWMIEKYGDNNLCISASSLPYCEETCEWHHTHDEEVEFNCWPITKVPREIKQAFDQGKHFITTEIGHEPYSYDQIIHVTLPSTCKHF